MGNTPNRRIEKYRRLIIVALLCAIVYSCWHFAPGIKGLGNHLYHTNGDVSITDLLSHPKRRYAVVSHVQNEDYLPYVLLLGYTIKKYNPTFSSPSVDLVVLVPLINDLSQHTIEQLEAVGWKIRLEDDIKLDGLERMKANWRRNFIKLRIWGWTEYSKIAFFDADTIVLGDISLLLSDGYAFGASPDVWPDSMPDKNFNSGVMSLTPSLETYSQLINITNTMPLFLGGDQELLNYFFHAPTPGPFYPSAYTRTTLPVKYDLNLEACRSHREKWNDVWPDVRVVHYTMPKPLQADQVCPDWSTCVYEQPLRRWWLEFEEMKLNFGW